MPDLDILEPPKRKRQGPAQHRINYALAATLLSQHLTYEQVAKQVGAKNANSLKAGMNRRGVTATLTRSNDFQTQRAVVIATKAVSQASEALRSKFSGLLDNAASKLCNVEVSANVKELKHLGEAAEPFVRMAKIVHDWGNDSPSGLVMVGEIAQVEENCGVDATAGSVPVEAQIVKTPQLSEGSCNQPIE